IHGTRNTSSPEATASGAPCSSIHGWDSEPGHRVTRTSIHRNGMKAQRTRRSHAWLMICLMALSLALACGGAFAQPAQPDIPLEYAVKATYLYKLAPFINWPPSAFTSPDAPFPICVVGDDPFDDFLVRAVSGRSFGTHPFVVRRLEALT